MLFYWKITASAQELACILQRFVSSMFRLTLDTNPSRDLQLGLTYFILTIDCFISRFLNQHASFKRKLGRYNSH